MNELIKQSTRPFAGIKRFVEANYFQSVLILFSMIVYVYLVNQASTHAFLKLFLPWMLLIMATSTSTRWWFWMLLLINAILVWDVFISFYRGPNHGFVIAYIGLALMICSVANSRDDLLRSCAGWMLTFLMGIAIIQKLSSAYYMDGNLLGGYIVTGQMYDNLLSFLFADWEQITQTNKDAAQQLRDTAPSVMKPVDMILPAGLTFVVMGLTYISIISQFIMEMFILFRKRLGIWVHVALLGFVVMIYSSRNEVVFLSMNCILGFALTDEHTKAARVFYVIWIIYLLAAHIAKVRPVFLT